MCGRGIGNSILNIPVNCITDLQLEITKAKTAQPMQFDKFSIIGYLKGYSTPHGNRHAKIYKSRVEHIEERHTESYLNRLGKVDKINLCLERRTAFVCQADNARQHREVFGFDDSVKRADDKVLHDFALLLVHEHRNLTLLNTERRSPADRIFPVIISCDRPGRMPLPYQI